MGKSQAYHNAAKEASGESGQTVPAAQPKIARLGKLKRLRKAAIKGQCFLNVLI